ncbi:unnamed protein product [Vitrella brassicaformis CCMP3155]|uniref:Uncharacterized protein n=2 Tax=Vitrella brassicaformis TaxID=1169539 RepID=A0A0G4FQS5_VITBC|nr:unnamed protein product [Vitrella brassicaformis CCMP3155]|eukprot:CEM16811.1 unnamed protein product [Vitrella brassicaformis CCMP3155]
MKEDTIYDKIEVNGEVSGDHSTGETLLLDDGRTVLFKPVDTFTPGERVLVSVKAGMETTEGSTLPSAAWNFTMSWRKLDTYSAYKAAQPQVDEEHTDSLTLGLLKKIQDIYWLDGISKNETWDEETRTDGSCNDASNCDDVDTFAAPNPAYCTLSEGYPRMRVTQMGDISTLAPGYVFISSGTDTDNSRGMEIIMTSEGDPVFHAEKGSALFSPTPEGQQLFTREGPRIRLVGPDYRETASFSAQHGQVINGHEFQVAKNGNGLLFAYDVQPLDTTKIRSNLENGGKKVWAIGVVIQEVTSQGHVLFEWRSWDHTPRIFWETPYIVIRHSGGRLWDLGHANSLEETDDNGVILSLRALSQAIKINRDTGKIEWRLGGESGDFEIVDDPHGRFIGQHDIRAPGGNRITVFDNARLRPILVPVNYPSYNSSRAVDYQLEFDRQGRPTVATLVNEYETGVKSIAWGSYRLLPNGNRVIGTGLALEQNPTYIEINGKSDALLTIHSSHCVYRAIKADWRGLPSWKPTALLDNNNPDKIVRLHFSWNGATEVSKWRILIGDTDKPTEVLEEVPRTQFEHWVEVPDSAIEKCTYLQAVAIDAKGRKLNRSAVVASPACTSE